MDNNKIIEYKNELLHLRSAISVKEDELNGLKSLEQQLLNTCNHELVLLYKSDYILRVFSTEKVKFCTCLICDKNSVILSDNSNTNVNSIIDITELISDNSKTDGYIEVAKRRFIELLSSGVSDIEEIKKGIKEEITRINNKEKLKKLK